MLSLSLPVFPSKLPSEMIKEDQWPRSKLCNACHASAPLLFCIPHSAFLCLACDMELHGDGGKLLLSSSCSTHHARLWICDVCEHAPAAFICAADAAALCFSCDAHIHGANSVAHRHQRSPVSPFFDCPPDLTKLPRPPLPPDVILDQSYDADADDDHSSDADAASWFQPFADLETLDAITAHTQHQKHTSCNRKADPLATELFPDADVLLDLEYMSSSLDHGAVTDSIVPFFNPSQADLRCQSASACAQPPLSHSISSSLDVGVVPYNEHKPTRDASVKGPSVSQMEPMAREARVQRYKEKKKNRKFEKTIRYASRKAYAERRPRIKGRFAKRNETEMQQFHDLLSDIPFGVVPSF